MRRPPPWALGPRQARSRPRRLCSLRPSTLPKTPTRRLPLRALSHQIIEFLNIEDYSTQTRCDVAIDEPLFQPYPSEVVFNKFGLLARTHSACAFATMIVCPAHQSASSRHTLHRVPRLRRPQSASRGKVAAGMEVCYEVTFLQREKRDYEYSNVCVTEREKFVLPVRASGTRACLDFPDQLSLGVSPVKHEAAHTFLVRNIGEKPTKFTLSATEPFSVYPRHGYAGPDSSVQISVLLRPPKHVRMRVNSCLSTSLGRWPTCSSRGGREHQCTS